MDAGARKPARAFFEYALSRCEAAAGEVLFVGNQLNADIAGGEAFGIRTVWLSDEVYRSEDDRPGNAAPTYTIATLTELPALLQGIRS